MNIFTKTFLNPLCSEDENWMIYFKYIKLLCRFRHPYKMLKALYSALSSKRTQTEPRSTALLCLTVVQSELLVY